jgi:Dockerin type I domain
MLKILSISILILLSLAMIAPIVAPVFALTGDVNGDGIVDLKDVMLVKNAFPSTPSSPDWNPAADLNHDNRVDLADIFIVYTNFGHHI